MFPQHSGFPFDLTKPPPPIDDSFPHPTLLEQLRLSDELLVEEFVSSHTQNRSISVNAFKSNPSINIATYRTEVRKVLHALKALKHSKLVLEELQKTPVDENDTRWSDEVERIEHLKNGLDSKLKELEDLATVTSVANKLVVRRKKRAWKKRRNARLKKAREKQQTDRLRRLEEISRWETEWKARLEKERTAREELQAKTLILADVRRRKARAKRYLGRFEKTIQLHQQRQGETLARDPVDDTRERFRRNVDALIAEWKIKLTDCIKEERLLKDELARRSAGNESRRRDNRWRKALFGDAAAAIGGRRTDGYDLLGVRWTWDSYAVPIDPTGVSTESKPGYPVPTGWVFPSEHPLPDWAIYREPTKSKPEKT
ncbi:programmed cell death protein 7-like [Anopheles ziemanni]|uniref:programmed cell death protein 7-like n=1 Tax=Anopheles coustani TaxID=139045 RepID=UPI002659F050|nr:programmed cell death protein 7-like [Anopheles coustani]XP_058171542.1 programmed cell death protein 7-like [Anopheles ziemanni]